MSHPDARDLALYAEFGEQFARAGAVETHLKACRLCAQDVAMARDIRDLEQEKSLHVPDAAPMPPRLATYVAGARKSEERSGSISSLGALAGLFSAGVVSDQALAVPALGHSAQIEPPSAGDTHHVRKYTSDPSLMGKEQHEMPAAHEQSSMSHSLPPYTSADTAHFSAGTFSDVDVRSGVPRLSDQMNAMSPTNSAPHPLENAGSASSEFTEAVHQYGVPATSGTSAHVQQKYSDTCAIKCQQLILNQFGVEVSEDDLVNEAKAKGIYNNGTRAEDIGKLLESHGLSVHRELDANVFNLATELAQGHKVIVGLDSGDLWHDHSIFESIADKLGFGAADHAVIVSGINTNDSEHPQVIVTDPGNGDVAKEYPLNEFLRAWKDSHFIMVATDAPAPRWLPEMVNFDYDAGHIPQIGHAPFEFAEQLSGAFEHEHDPTLIDNLESAFLCVVDGNVSLDQVGGADVLAASDAETLKDLLADLLAIGHGEQGRHPSDERPTEGVLTDDSTDQPDTHPSFPTDLHPEPIVGEGELPGSYAPDHPPGTHHPIPDVDTLPDNGSHHPHDAAHSDGLSDQFGHGTG